MVERYMGSRCQHRDVGGGYGEELRQGFGKLLLRRRWERRGDIGYGFVMADHLLSPHFI
jgi:hypothetical protein